MLAGEDTFKIHGEYVPVRAQVVPMENLSAHADYDGILTWLSRFEAAPKTTFLRHGEPEAAHAVGERIHESLHWQVKVPAHGDRFNL